MTTVTLPDGSSYELSDGLLYEPDGSSVAFDNVITQAATMPLDSAGGDWFSKVVDALPSIAAFVTSEQLAQINIQRAAHGLSPLNAAAYGPQVGVSLSPQTQQMLMWGALAIGGFLLLNKKS